jgi:hypothetical protein
MIGTAHGQVGRAEIPVFGKAAYTCNLSVSHIYVQFYLLLIIIVNNLLLVYPFACVVSM